MIKSFLIYIMVFGLNAQEKITSKLEIFDIYKKSRKVIYEYKSHFEAPNWSNDGKYLIFNQQGYLYKINLNSLSPKLIDTDFATRCNNDHGISPLGDMLVISHAEKESNLSLIYTLPINGGMPKLITKKGPSYWHGWSPDGKFIAYASRRSGVSSIYRIDPKSKEENRVTPKNMNAESPTWSPDGSMIAFSGKKGGDWKIYYSLSSGGQAIRLTNSKAGLQETMPSWGPSLR